MTKIISYSVRYFNVMFVRIISDLIPVNLFQHTYRQILLIISHDKVMYVNAKYRIFSKMQCFSIIFQLLKTFSTAIDIIVQNVWTALFQILFLFMTSRRYIHDVKLNHFPAKSRNSHDENLHQTLNGSRRCELYMYCAIIRGKLKKFIDKKSKFIWKWFIVIVFAWLID